MMEADWRKVIGGDLPYASPSRPIGLTAMPKRTPPEIGHPIPERGERPDIGWDRVVAEVAGHDLP